MERKKNQSNERHFEEQYLAFRQCWQEINSMFFFLIKHVRKEHFSREIEFCINIRKKGKKTQRKKF